MEVKLEEEDAPKAKAILDGFQLHIQGLKEEYDEFIKIKISEV